VGGISIARGLLRDGHNVTVFEQRPDMRPGGGAVTIWSNGSTVLEQLGVDMDGAGQLLSTVRIATSTGRTLATIDLTAIVDRLGGPVRMVPRRVVLDRLLEGFPADRIRCNSRAVGAVSTHDGVRIEFDDGSKETVQWPAEERWHRFLFERPVRATSAQLDPDREVLLDLDKLDDGRTRERNLLGGRRWVFEFKAWAELAFALLEAL